MTGSDNQENSFDDRDWGLTCAEFLELTTDYLEDALPVSDNARFETHLGRCKGCATVLDQLRTQITLTGKIDEDQIEPEVLDRLLSAFADWRTAKES